jgi:DNA-binding MarR family transcriptional regulator
MMRLLEDRISRSGVSSGMWWFLRVLWSEDGISQAELCERLGVMSATTVRAIDRLERSGLVERRPNPTDKRIVNVHLTNRGRELEASLLPEAIAVQKLASASLSKEEEQELRRLLHKVLTNIKGKSSIEASLRPPKPKS